MSYSHFQVKQGFGPNKVKEYFVVQRDGDVQCGVITGPFENEAQGRMAIEALKLLYFKPLELVGGHLVSYRL